MHARQFKYKCGWILNYYHKSMNATMIEVWGWKQNIMGVARIYKQLFIVFVTSPRCVRSLSPPPLPRWSRPTRYNKRVVYWFGRGPWLCFWFQHTTDISASNEYHRIRDEWITWMNPNAVSDYLIALSISTCLVGYRRKIDEWSIPYRISWWSVLESSTNRRWLVLSHPPAPMMPRKGG